MFTVKLFSYMHSQPAAVWAATQFWGFPYSGLYVRGNPGLFR